MSCERVAIGPVKSQFYPSFFGDRTSFRAKGLRRTLGNSQFYPSFWRSNLISCERVAPGRTAPRLQERNRKEGESKRAREPEGKRARGQERT